MSKLSQVLIADELGQVIDGLVRTYKPKTVLEIGSSDGTGSTQVFINAMKATGGELFCLEMQAERYAQLVLNTAQYDFVHTIYCSSVGVEGMMPWSKVEDYHQMFPQWNCWKSLTMEEFKTWYDNQTKQIPLMDEGIFITDTTFEMVFIDGSPFTALEEFHQVEGAGIIILDDTMDIKCFDVFNTLTLHPDYMLIHRNDKYRNGYAVFKYKDYANS